MVNIWRDLDRLPNEHELHHWADYAELNCVASRDQLYSPGQLLQQIRHGRDSGDATTATTQGDPVLTDEELDTLLGVGDDAHDANPGSTWDADLDVTTSDDDQSLSGAALHDSFSRRVEDIWIHLQYRSKTFGPMWPFLMDETTRTLILTDELNEHQRTYLFLLQCSSLRYHKKATSSQLTTVFEQVALKAFAAAFAGWEVHIFGTGAPADSHFGQAKLWDRVQVLSEDLRTPITAQEEEFSEHDLGDNGLDLVAWLPLPDKSKGLPMAFAQCACGASNWKMKQGEATEQRWGQTLYISSPISNWTFIPFCYHGPQGIWETSHHVQKGVLVDRLRLCYLIEEQRAMVGPLLDSIDWLRKATAED
jgi:hypothetical protein